ncbi:helix-turn-helix domain-containing protein [Enterobacter asburiae]
MQEKHNLIPRDEGMSLNNIGKNLTYLMQLKGIDSQQLSDRIGVGIATIKNLKRGVGNPTISTLLSIADFFNVSIGALTDQLLDGEKTISANNARVLPLIKFNETEAFLEKKALHTDTYTTEVDNEEDDSLFVVEITSRALQPELDKGTLCVISRKEEYYDGDIVLLKIKDYPLCFRRIFIGNDGYQFCNISMGTEMEMKQYTDFQIIGVMLKKINRLR